MNQDNIPSTPPMSPTHRRAREIRCAIEGGQLRPMRARGFTESDKAYADRVNDRASLINRLIEQQLAQLADAPGDAAPAVMPNF